MNTITVDGHEREISGWDQNLKASSVSGIHRSMQEALAREAAKLGLVKLPPKEAFFRCTRPLRVGQLFTRGRQLYVVTSASPDLYTARAVD